MAKRNCFSRDQRKAYWIGVGMKASDESNRCYNHGLGSSNPFRNDPSLASSWQHGYFHKRNPIADLDCKAKLH